MEKGYYMNCATPSYTRNKSQSTIKMEKGVVRAHILASTAMYGGAL
jgi:hypothetical protein